MSYVAIIALLFMPLSLTFTLAHAATDRTLDLNLGSRLTGFAYKEELPAPYKSTETAFLATVYIDGKIYAADKMSSLEIRYETAANVKSAYAGSDLNTGAAVSSTDTLTFADYSGQANLALSESATVYLGYGYRKWDRFLSGVPGYREIYSWYYTPIGGIFWLHHDGLVDIGADISLRPTSRAFIDVITSQTYSGGQDSQMGLGTRTGYKLALPVIWHLGTYSLTTTPWFEHSEIGQSPVVTNSTLSPTAGTGIQEPNSKTDQFGMELLFGFSL